MPGIIGPGPGIGTDLTHSAASNAAVASGDAAPSPAQLAHAYSGWADLRQVLNHHLPNRLEQSRVARRATLQALRARHRVRG